MEFGVTVHRGAMTSPSKVKTREHLASCVCVHRLVPSWLEVRVLLSHESVCVVSRDMRGPSKSLAKVSLRVTVIPSTRQGQSCLCHGLCR